MTESLRSLSACLIHQPGRSPLAPDGFACKDVPGLAGFLSWYLGITEPQLRKSLHLHAVLGGLGFRDLDRLLQGSLRQIAELFVSVWKYVASVCFRSPEAYAASMPDDAGMPTLALEPLLDVKPQQERMIGPERAASSYAAQREARGIEDSTSKPDPDAPRPFESIAPKWIADKKLSGRQWGAKAARHFNTSFRSCGNHCCTPRVCFKGKYGKKGLCRMLFWHWAPVHSKRGKNFREISHETIERATLAKKVDSPSSRTPSCV